ncbi:hypothetical protein B0H14DRAFT_2565246 [Mycena olivaceomarginata]|nr:hypothetical protein B0H14DRAFT_2565246 [Mycena olivaceomarginata]
MHIPKSGALRTSSFLSILRLSTVLIEKYTPPDLFQFGTDEMVELCEGLVDILRRTKIQPKRPPVKCSVLNREAKHTGKRNDGSPASPESCSVLGPWALNALQSARLGVFDVEDSKYQNSRP